MKSLPPADPAPEPSTPSLLDAAAARLRRPRGGEKGKRPAPAGPAISVPPRRIGWLLALGLPLGPLLGAGVAMIDAERIDARTAELRNSGRDRLAADAVNRADRAAIASGVPGFAATLDALARTLPDEARLRAVARDGDGRLFGTVATVDPDTLRAALRRDPLTARLRDSGQRQVEGAIEVTLGEPAR
ncbi:hypothetical protein [Sphingomonas baiyangensis]|uniref:Uncharacterized protein n=1 Tax=Sphingomonas baiyangensis TaxID=2572576 RepID=A0A4U1L847_9SPHN|nr:hypothetical protein [Sphingomonas baiyangensis]TKD53122.1 hypothetical protein FBR43_01940 [Sphingomonas baiyangensis]